MKWYVLILVFLVSISILSVSCSNSNYTTVDNPNWFSIKCPSDFEHSINPTSMGSSPELDVVKNITVTLTDSSGNPVVNSVPTISICIYGVNGSYSDVVDYDSNVAPLTKGRLVTKNANLSIFKWAYPPTEGPNGQNLYIVCDMGNLRTVVVWGSTNNVSESTGMNVLSQYCTDIANSITVSDSWVSNGQGP